MKSILIFLAISCFAIGGLLAWFVPRAWIGTSEGEVISIEIEEGWDAARLATELENKSIIDSATGYRWYAKVDSAGSQLKAGAYQVNAGESYQHLVRTFAIGPARDEVTITVPEGMDLPKIAALLSEYGVTEEMLDAETGDLIADGSVNDVWREEYPFLNALPVKSSLEGYLFPNTYRVWRDQLPQSLIKKQLDEFAERADKIATEAQKQGRTLHEVVTLASIVEREISGAEHQKIVAGIFMNRLKLGMALQSDATVSYLTRSGRARSTLEDLEVNSPYNTYKNKGLPPGPISNPGDSALDAALHPADTSYYYFLTDDAGKVYYASTFEEHQQNRRKAYGS